MSLYFCCNKVPNRAELGLLADLLARCRRPALVADRFLADCSGGALVYCAFVLPVFFGVMGLAVDVSLWHASKRSVQGMADAAAIGAVLEVTRLQDNADPEAAATLEATTNGLNAGAGDTIEVNNPPTLGAFAGNDDAYEVIVRRQVPTLMARLVFSGNTAVVGRAVGTIAVPGGTCVLALEPSAKAALKVNNGALAASGCEVQVNSDSTQGALDVANNGSLEADAIYVNGTVVEKGYISPSPDTGVTPQTDPLASLPTPSTTGCDNTDVGYSGGSHSLSPGTYCGGIKISGNADVTLQPGTYVIKDSTLLEGSLDVTGGSLSGTEVTVYYHEDASYKVSGNGSVDLKAPDSGDYTGILMYGDPNAPEDTTHSTNGNGTIKYDGVMYFPTAELRYMGNGNGTSDGVKISMVIARLLKFGGNGTLNFFFANDAVLPPTLSSKLGLVE